MTASLIDGKVIAQQLRATVKEKVSLRLNNVDNEEGVFLDRLLSGDIS